MNKIMSESELGFNPESKKTISSIESIINNRSIAIESRDQLQELVESPLLTACEELYDKNIPTLSSSANKNDLAAGKVYVNIDYEALSDENKKIAKTFGDPHFFAPDNETSLQLAIAVNENTTEDEIREKFEKIVRQFHRQALRVKSDTLEDLRKEWKIDDITLDELKMTPQEYFLGMGYYYDPISNKYFESEARFRRAEETKTAFLAISIPTSYHSPCHSNSPNVYGYLLIGASGG
jgi:hypothetical protein